MQIFGDSLQLSFVKLFEVPLDQLIGLASFCQWKCLLFIWRQECLLCAFDHLLKQRFCQWNREFLLFLHLSSDCDSRNLWFGLVFGLGSNFYFCFCLCLRFCIGFRFCLGFRFCFRFCFRFFFCLFCLCLCLFCLYLCFCCLFCFVDFYLNTRKNFSAHFPVLGY